MTNCCSKTAISFFSFLLPLLVVLQLPASAAEPVAFSTIQNQLSKHASPYLAMHGNDPVLWQEWGAEVLERARREKKLIFISSGYFSCHWCHVMHRESYSDKTIAALLNENFIPVKIDRELRPALDDYLIEFVQQTTGQAGWPLNAFITPEGYPLIGMTYVPPESFHSLLQRVADTWQLQSVKATQLAKALVDSRLQQDDSARKATGRPEYNELIQLAVSQALDFGDEFEGGFGSQSRFPMAPQLLVLLDYLRRNENRELAGFLTTTLDQMKNLGLRDHIHGGFFRYTVDPGWSEPHFEKMLYTQALLVRVYLDAAEVLQRPDYLAVARDTLDFVLRDMRAEKGGFVSSFSAIDSKGNEGGGYLWQLPELEQLLTKQELNLVRSYWVLSPEPHFEMGYLPVSGLSLAELSARTGEPLSGLQTRLTSMRKKLRAKNKVAAVPVDDKVLTAWNALLLSALSQAAMQLKDDHYRQQAGQLRDFLIRHAWDGSHLSRAKNNGHAIGRAGLEDYAYLARALADHALLSESEEDWYLANLFAAKAWMHFFKPSGWRTGNENLLPGMAGQAAIGDGALPAADAVLMRLSINSDNAAISQKARDAAAAMSVELSDSPFSYASHMQWLRSFQAESPTGAD